MEYYAVLDKGNTYKLNFCRIPQCEFVYVFVHDLHYLLYGTFKLRDFKTVSKMVITACSCFKALV